MRPRRAPLKRTAWNRIPTHHPATEPRTASRTTLDDWDTLTVDELWPLARMIPLRRDRFTCGRCGQAGSDVHHRIPLQMGGRRADPTRHDPPRLITLCRTCHRWVHAHPADARVTGYTIATTAPVTDPTTVPILLYTGWVMFSQDGRMSTFQLSLR